MNLGFISNILTNENIGIIGIDKENTELGYITNDQELDEIIEIILDNEKLELQIEEDLSGNKLIRREEVDLTNSYYLMAFNYYLPSPWKITKVIYKDGDLSQNIENLYNSIINKDMEVEFDEKESK